MSHASTAASPNSGNGVALSDDADSGDAAGGGTLAGLTIAPSVQSTDTSSVNLAVAEGSDATGATAAALQAATAAGAPAAAATLGALANPAAQLIASASPVLAAVTSSAALPAAIVASLDGDSRERAGTGTVGASSNSGDNTAALQQLSSAPASPSTDAAPAATVRVHAGVDSGDFAQGLADRVSFAIGNGWDSAKVQVTPPQLGPIDLQIAVQGEHAQISMMTHSAVTREALEASIPKLREMLGAQGFTQVSVDISQRSFQERSAAPQLYVWSPPSQGSAAPVASASATRVSQGILDAYA